MDPQVRERIESLEALQNLAASVASAVLSQEAGRARNVITVALPAYTYVAGVITGNANGAMGAQDGVTNVAGDVVFLQEGLAVAAAEQGAYVVVRPGSAGTTFQLQRVSWMAEGAILRSGFEVRMGGEGTVFQNTVWAAFVAANTFTVGTTDSDFFPRQVSGQGSMGGGAPTGTFTITGIPVLSVLSGVAVITTAEVTADLTVRYQAVSAASEAATGIIPGNSAVASVRIAAAIAAGTINAADGSTLNWTITNQNR